ncbi:HNH endonuclease [Hymenobacter sp. BT175]|uniref:HNH endonuclease n=1 Tax=Hymenobacter translucens TaxID=2886507 RepID=UPI001D0EFB71|nr:HNH endonuclease [Hymenobacter translucens]MCC2547427.1 HNH endonuclease [Hymenobacter translucens]
MIDEYAQELRFSSFQLSDPQCVMPQQYWDDSELIEERVAVMPINAAHGMTAKQVGDIVRKALFFMYLPKGNKNSPLDGNREIRESELKILAIYLDTAEMYMFRKLKNRTNNGGRYLYGEAALRQMQKARFCCENCSMPNVFTLDIDHIHGRKHDRETYQILCSNCHRHKTATTLEPMSRDYGHADLIRHIEERAILIAKPGRSCYEIVPAGTQLTFILSYRRGNHSAVDLPSADYTLRMVLDEPLLAHKHTNGSLFQTANCCCRLQSITYQLPDEPTDPTVLDILNPITAHSIDSLVHYVNTTFFLNTATPKKDWTLANFVVVSSVRPERSLEEYRQEALPISPFRSSAARKQK